MATNDPPHWYALRLRSRADFTVRDELTAAGIEAFCPTFEVTTRWTDRERTTTRPLFAGYLFARFDRTEAARILQTRGVVQILGTDNTPAEIDDSVIADLRRAVANPKRVAPCPYVAGAAVTVSRGPFAGVTGVVSRVTGATLLSIPIAILGRSVSVQIDAADVEDAAK